MQLPGVLFRGSQTPRDPRIERLIAVARVALVVVALLALAIDPLDPPEENAAILHILLAYLGLSLIFAVIDLAGWRPRAWKIVTHAADVGVAALLVDISSLSVSPFFSYFLFVLLAATLRWDMRGAIWTTAGAFVLFVAIVWTRMPSMERMLADPTSPLNRAVVQASFLLVGGALLAFFGRLNERNRARLAQLAAWPSPASANSADETPLAAILEHAAEVMKSPRIVVLWREADEPFVASASWSKARYADRRERNPDFNGTFAAMVSPELEATSFATNDAGSRDCLAAGGRRALKDLPIHPALVSRFAMRGVATAGFQESICRGRVFLLDREDWGLDDVVLVEIVAARIGAELEQQALRLQVEEIGAVRERARLARDLHDGVLQNLTAVRFRLAALAPEIGEKARAQLGPLTELLREEQRRIREFVDATRSPVAAAPAPGYELRAEIERLIGKARETWGCNVGLSVTPQDAVIPRGVGRDLGLIIAECLANAIRHGKAQRIDVDLRQRTDRLLMHIRNDGAPIDGRLGSFDLRGLDELNLGPRSVRERIASLGGSLLLTNREEGVELEMSLPLP